MDKILNRYEIFKDSDTQTGVVLDTAGKLEIIVDNKEVERDIGKDDWSFWGAMYKSRAFSEGVQLTFDANREIPASVDISWSGDGCGDLGENTQTKQIENKEKNTVTTY